MRKGSSLDFGIEINTKKQVPLGSLGSRDILGDLGSKLKYSFDKQGELNT